jgi:hypothetical protein
MLSKDVFNSGIKKLTTEYGDKGFTMTKDKSIQWYEFMKNMADDEFKAQIDRCLTECNHVPYMADVVNGYKKDGCNSKEFDFTGIR